jgi:hypothetical protein
MRDSTFVGWVAMNALTSAVVFSVLLIYDPLNVLAKDGRGAVVVTGGLAAIAVVVGGLSFKSSPGRFAAVGGIVILVVIGLGSAYLSLS